MKELKVKLNKIARFLKLIFSAFGRPLIISFNSLDFQQLWVIFNDVEKNCVDVSLEASAFVVFLLISFLEL